MSDERIIDEEAVFNAAVAIDEADRQLAYLRQACGGDPTLLARMQALLRVHANERSFLEQAADSLPLQLTIEAPGLVEGLGTVIDRYKLLEKIGEGGMAVVYMAEQQCPIRRRVALKIIKLGMDTKNVIARFEVERQALALMDHPNIAKVFDGGATDTGRPYFVMELVRGVSITDYCDQNRLSTRERLGLFVQVCNAVQHAHQKGIIHRDIKPSNVMVTLHDGKPVPKVIDFGIAKATNQRLTEQTLFTRYSQMIGTPEYMSPEQAEMSGLDIDTRTDIYSLGVLLYELLTGETPFASETLRDAGYAEMQRIIRETDPLKPSTRIRTLGRTHTEVARSRQSTLEMLSKLVKGDLDWIVMKTLEKDRTRRYETAHALAEDIERHLRHEPILAGSPSTMYRMHKFLRRHRAKVIAWSGLTVVLAGLLLARFSIQQTRGNHERLLTLAEDMLSRGEYSQALSKIEPILSSRYVGPKARLLHARTILETQGPRAAVEELQPLLKQPPEVAANAHFLLARIYLQGDPNDPRIKGKAEIHLQQGERLMPKTAEAYLLRAMMVPTVREILAWLNDALGLDPAHYGARRTLALARYALGEYHEMETEASMMIGSQPNNPVGYTLRAVARREMGLAKNDTDMLDQALLDHDRAAGLTGPRDKRRAEVCDERRQTLMRMGRYEQALADVQTCLRLQPENILHKFDLFFVLTALGRQEEAQAKYDEIAKAGPTMQYRLDAVAARHVFDSLAAGQPWHPPDNIPEGTAFTAMHRAAEQYEQLTAVGKRVVAEGFHPSWSPDGKELAYSRGVLSSSGIEIRNLQTGKTRLLALPGKDPAWSPDGRYIAYVSDRQALSLADLTQERQGEHRPFEQEEIWLVKADGSEAPRFLARGGWPNWTADSGRVYYQARSDDKMSCISIDPQAPRPQKILDSTDMFPVASPDGKYVALMKGEAALQIVDVSNGSPVSDWTGPLNRQQLFLNWSPDGTRLSVGCYAGGGLWIYDVQSKKASRILDGSYSWCAWSNPPNDRLAIEKVYAQWHHEIWITDQPLGSAPAASRIPRTGNSK